MTDDLDTVQRLVGKYGKLSLFEMMERLEQAEGRMAEAATMREACRMLFLATAKPEFQPTPCPTLYDAVAQACAALHADAGRALLDELAALREVKKAATALRDEYDRDAPSCIDDRREELFARLDPVRKDKTPIIKCDVESCHGRVTHAEHWYNRVRYWCDDHVPMSGHYEHCPEPCGKLVAGIDSAREKKVGQPSVMPTPFVSDDEPCACIVCGAQGTVGCPPHLLAPCPGSTPASLAGARPSDDAIVHAIAELMRKAEANARALLAHQPLPYPQVDAKEKL